MSIFQALFVAAFRERKGIFLSVLMKQQLMNMKVKSLLTAVFAIQILQKFDQGSPKKNFGKIDAL